MPFYEIIYEPGNKSIAFYEDDEEAQGALAAHHKRAINGEPGTPTSTPRTDLAEGEVKTVGTWPAERIKKVLVYDEHPGSFMEDHVIEVKELESIFKSAIADSAMEGLVHVPTIAAAIRDATSPLVPDRELHPHASQYKAKEDKELNLAFLKDLEA